MTFTPHEYQQRAIGELIKSVRDSQDAFERYGELSAIALTAPTGAGKTVIAAFVIEHLLVGPDADPDAVVLWLSDSPSLNVQTAERFSQISADLTPEVLQGTGVVRTIEAGRRGRQAAFDSIQELEPGCVYLVNRQLFAETSRLEKAGERGDGVTLRDVIDKAIRERHLVLFIDEAHRGIGRASREDDAKSATIYSSIIDGLGGHEVPHVVVGVSATPRRFMEVMNARSHKRTLRPAITVTPAEVQDSGLIVDEIDLHVPASQKPKGDLDWLDMACDRLAELDGEWADYAEAHPSDPRVRPLLLVQVENRSRSSETTSKAEAERVEALARHIAGRIPSLARYPMSFANAFGAHMDAGDVKYVYPERVQEDDDVRVLFVREAVSAGWDCPRASVMWSARRHVDSDYVVQLIGRLTRTPLAKRAGEPGSPLNRVSCYLPRFAAEQTKGAVDYLTGRTAGFSYDPMVPVGRVLVNPVEVTWGGGFDPAALEDVERAWDTIPTAIIPRKSSNAFRSLVNAASLFIDLGWDAPLIERSFPVRLDAIAAEHPDEWNAAVDSVEHIHGSRIVIDRITGEEHVEQIVEDAGMPSIDAAAGKAARMFTKVLAIAYQKACRAKLTDRGAKIRLAAAMQCDPVREALESWAGDTLDSMMDAHAADRAFLTGEQRERFDTLEGGGVTYRPLKRPVPLKGRHSQSKYPSQTVDGSLPQWAKHVYADRQGVYYSKFNDLETKVLDVELARDRTIAWYRNPSLGLDRSFTIPYETADGTHGLHPDFIFFTRTADGGVRPSVVDPHGDHLADSLAKLIGWCDWLDQHSGVFAQVLSVSDTADGVRFLDLTDVATRSVVRAWQGVDATGLYTGPMSHPYR